MAWRKKFAKFSTAVRKPSAFVWLVGQAEPFLSNILAHLPDDLPQELIETLVRGQRVRIERIVSRGHISPDGFWYEQDEHEFVLVVRGSARLRFQDGVEESVIEMKAGDWLDIPARRQHRVEWTTPLEPTVWLAVFYS
jgi:cupin 2 domain-containing protein